MIEWVISLASYDVMESGALGDLFVQWEQIGVFSYVLPLLLIFALVFGILTKVKLFKDNKAINAIIALVVSLMAIQLEFVPTFFAQIFPRVGIALAVILTLFVLLGLFLDPEHPAMNWILMGIGAIVFIIVIFQSTKSMGWFAGNWLQENWVTLVGIGIVLALVIAVIAGSSKPQIKDPKSLWARDLLSGGK